MNTSDLGKKYRLLRADATKGVMHKLQKLKLV